MQAFQVFGERVDLIFHDKSGFRLCHDEVDLLRVERFGDIVERAEAHGLNRGVNGGVCGNDADLEPRGIRQQFRDQAKPAVVAKPQIKEDKVEFAVAVFLKGVSGVFRLTHLLPVGFQPQHQCLSYIRLVIDNQYIQHRSSPFGTVFFFIHGKHTPVSPFLQVVFYFLPGYIIRRTG